LKELEEHTRSDTNSNNDSNDQVTKFDLLAKNIKMSVRYVDNLG
jgi:hypothetical protein